MLRPSMRRGFEHDMRQACFDHFCQVTLYIMRIWCGDVETCIQHFIPYHRIDRRNHASLEPGRHQDVVDQVAGGGFTVRAGHADHRQLASRPIVKRSSQIGQGLTRVLEPDVRQIANPPCEFTFPHHRDRTLVDCHRDIIVSIHRSAWHGDKQVTGLNNAAINGNASNSHIGKHSWREFEWKV